PRVHAHEPRGGRPGAPSRRCRRSGPGPGRRHGLPARQPMTTMPSTLPPPSRTALRPDHSAGLDLLRTVACLMVVAFHLHAILGIDFGPANWLVNGGDAGVFIFFVLSGYLLYRPFVRGEVDLASYALKRAARI